MIICSCSVLTEKDIHSRIDSARKENGNDKVKMSQIYQDNGKRCHSCVHRIKEIVLQH